VPTNSGENAGQDLPDEAADEATAAGDQAEAVETTPSPLQRSQEAIDQGWDAARDALKDTLLDEETDEETNSSQPDQNAGPEAEDSP
jgi:hypothetical protein